MSPTPVIAGFATIASGASVIAKFTVSAADVDVLWGWSSGMGWHPCLLASVSADNDYAWASASTGASPQVRRNNIAQRNLSVVDVVASASASVAFPFIAGNVLNGERVMELVVDRSRIPSEMSVLLSVDDDGSAFPRVRFETERRHQDRDASGSVFLERTRIETTFGCCRGVLTLEAGSRFDCPESRGPVKVSVRGGEVIVRGNKRFVEIRADVAVVGVEKAPNAIYPFSLHTQIPPNANSGTLYRLSVSQRDGREETVGGASVVYRVK